MERACLYWSRTLRSRNKSKHWN